ncbi:MULTISPECIES: type V toxin-antitoxin system endoribonuclease antitoxin GhoS [unclassified Pseudocitrobacter]|uniref:type V toxin-antitoxin system endoribonuclease antitoxin GhoS n=1 Tax=unclassified Pseudocitrobacter TaxID=2638778 RepID=UPI0023E389C5|nr:MULTISPECIES: type V toxin-antitoxin system endoribonuclease antitoxin GhoS [unclassified Pseudocitrobacter]MDF3827607.1 type V toxin-antitoxin system endoribonuclease antitoxin GhoS [Pseudocitrobacter sp. 2023EL-00150]MEC5374133.1 type V toxin-antitoxin system endoribonuclease antitoxin GhoS [Pseudocitrobacter sp. MW920760]
MMSGDITRYVVTIKFQEETLTELNELNNHLTRAGFTLTLTDDEGKVHELGTNTFGLVSPQNSQEIKALVSGLADTAIGKSVDIDVITFEQWLKDQ